MAVIDTCGRSCPEPVLMTKKAIAEGGSSYEILVDNQTALGNVTRFAGNHGFSVEVKERDNLYALLLTRT